MRPGLQTKGPATSTAVICSAPARRHGRLSRTAGFVAASVSFVLIFVSGTSIPLGALLCGALVDHAPAPRHLTYALVPGLLLTAVVLLVLSPETVLLVLIGVIIVLVVARPAPSHPRTGASTAQHQQ